MNSTKKTARLAGLLWFLIAVTAGFSLIYVRPKLIVFGDAATTVNNIVASESLFRASIASTILSQVLSLFFGLTIFKLFKGVDKTLAMILLTSLLVGVGVGSVNSFNNLAALVLVSNADYVKAFEPAQLNALAMTFLRLNNYGIGLVEIFTAIYLFTLGLLIVRSRYMPRILGILLMIGACAFPINSFTKILIPQFYPVLMTRITMLLNAFGAPATILWLLIKGANEQPPVSEQAQYREP
jgi:hypothetical protein